MKKNRNERDNVEIIAEMNKIDVWPIHQWDEIRFQQDWYQETMERRVLRVNFVYELELER
jgi:hypothetical protein